MQELKFTDKGFVFEELEEAYSSWIVDINKDDLIECLLNGDTGAVKDLDANCLKNLISQFECLNQYVSFERINISSKVTVCKIHFINSNYNNKSLFNITINSKENIKYLVRKGDFHLSEKVTACFREIDELSKCLPLHISYGWSYEKGEPIFEYPIYHDLYFSKGHDIFCFPFIRLINKELKSMGVECFIDGFSYKNYCNLHKELSFGFSSEKNTGRHWYTTTYYKGTIDMYNLSVKIEDCGSDRYKF